MSVRELTSVVLPAPGALSLAGAALFLDLDGTLAPIAAKPQDVRPDARRTTMLIRLQQALDGRLAVVSGRTLADIDRILDGCVPCVAAIHGLIRREADATVVRAQPHPDLPMAAERLRAFAGRDPGLILEEKGLSLALHYRLAPAAGDEARRLTALIAAETGLVLQHGDMVEELRTPGPSKGDSVDAFMAKAPFRGATPVFLGDDQTDEHGFLAVRALGGLGVLVGIPRATAASARLPDVEATLAWLEAAL